MNFVQQRCDDMLFQITQELGHGCDGLLDAVFGFLYRRTDFFYVMEPGGNMGFPPGQAINKVVYFFNKYQELHFKRVPYDPKIEEKWEKYQKEQQEKRKQEESKKAEEASKPKESQEAQESADNKEKPQEPLVGEQKSEPVKVEEKFKRISTYNGDVLDRYSWGQGVWDVTVQLGLPPGTKPKMLDVTMTQTNICIKLKGEPEPLLEGEFYDRIKVEDSFWSVEDDNYLMLNLEKAREVIWATVLKGDREIDTKNVDNAKKLNEFDLETQGHLQKVLYEQNRKLRGLPTTEEQKQIDLMNRLKKMPGSPFYEHPKEFKASVPEKKKEEEPPKPEIDDF
eukprot:TRINITY_DN11141_c0_g1_i2.p1 TRINITY_DN11141_c0_g1~~TRINITY_DN11141_c0_g1_i2.p1  ORF type:complete len:338 (+),score=121.21 TRINITY_DN11141_c0_g1_i2:156-1169(+)